MQNNVGSCNSQYLYYNPCCYPQQSENVCVNQQSQTIPYEQCASYSYPSNNVYSYPYNPVYPQNGGYSGVKIEIHNPVAYPVCPSGGYMTNPQGQYDPNSPYAQNGINGQNGGYMTNPQGQYDPNSPYAQNGINGQNNQNNQNNNSLNGNTNSSSSTTNTNENKKTEKRDIVILTDEYIKSLENFLNSPDSESRLIGAKEVAARLQEDPSRRDDKALNALINKMLQDPSSQVRIIALSMLDNRLVSGDALTKQLLENMQNSKTSYGQDSLLAGSALLKMAGKVGQKEFELSDEEIARRARIEEQKNKAGK